MMIKKYESKTISSEEYYSKNVIGFTDKEIDKIKNIFRNSKNIIYKETDIFNDEKGLIIKNKFLKSYPIMIINKLEDDYYQISYINKYPPDYYLCDQLSDLILTIKSIIISHDGFKNKKIK